MTRDESLELKFRTAVEHLRSLGWDVKITDEGSSKKSLVATSHREWWDRTQILTFGYERYQWGDGSWHTVVTGRFYAEKTSASRRIDRRVNGWKDLHSTAQIYRNHRS